MTPLKRSLAMMTVTLIPPPAPPPPTTPTPPHPNTHTKTHTKAHTKTHKHMQSNTRMCPLQNGSHVPPTHPPLVQIKFESQLYVVNGAPGAETSLHDPIEALTGDDDGHPLFAVSGVVPEGDGGVPLETMRVGVYPGGGRGRRGEGGGLAR